MVMRAAPRRRWRCSVWWVWKWGEVLKRERGWIVIVVRGVGVVDVGGGKVKVVEVGGGRWKERGWVGGGGGMVVGWAGFGGGSGWCRLLVEESSRGWDVERVLGV